MNALLRSAIIVLVVVPMAVCLFGLRFACDSADVRQLMREVHNEEELQKLDQATFARLEARQEVVRQLLARRCSLIEALARFQELDHQWPEYVMEASKNIGWIWSDEERNYQRIIDLAKGLLKNRPEEATVVLRRLEQEYQQLGVGRKGLRQHRRSGQS